MKILKVLIFGVISLCLFSCSKAIDLTPKEAEVYQAVLRLEWSEIPDDFKGKKEKVARHLKWGNRTKFFKCIFSHILERI